MYVVNLKKKKSGSKVSSFLLFLSFFDLMPARSILSTRWQPLSLVIKVTCFSPPGTAGRLFVIISNKH